jgi:peptidoglycan/xylan/chitin deacetylase (PgdA/CDA1 family)
MTNPLTVALKGKGFSNLLKRSFAIGRRYGLTPTRIDHIMGRFARVLGEFDCGATFPLTAWTLPRSKGILEKYQNHGIEFAVHGYHHVDHSGLSLEGQLDSLNKAQQVFEAYRLHCSGFRCPYLRWNRNTLAALRQLNYAYDSSQALAWNVTAGSETEAYRRALRFYRAQSAEDHPALPRLTGKLVRIPYCLPDDEALVERLQLNGKHAMAEVWLEILRRTYASGELFTLGLHPERIALCEGALRAVLSQARSLSPGVWIARLDEIAAWWRDRAQTTYQVTKETGNAYRLTVNGPAGTTILARSVKVHAPTEPWSDGYRRVLSADLAFQADKWPFIGLAPDVPVTLISFLRQQGYLVATGADVQSCTLHLDRRDFTLQDERPLLAEIERGTWPLLRLARWPDAAQSALAVTGDIDALTLWDYVLRAFNARP